jgi:hypothetical protein
MGRVTPNASRDLLDCDAQKMYPENDVERFDFRETNYYETQSLTGTYREGMSIDGPADRSVKRRTKNNAPRMMKMGFGYAAKSDRKQRCVYTLRHLAVYTRLAYSPSIAAHKVASQ